MNSCVVLNYLKCVLRMRSALVTAVRSHNLSRFTIQQVTIYKGGHTQYCYSTMSSESAVANVAPLEGNEDAADVEKATAEIVGNTVTASTSVEDATFDLTAFQLIIFGLWKKVKNKRGELAKPRCRQ